MKPDGMSAGLWYWSFTCSYRSMSFDEWWNGFTDENGPGSLGYSLKAIAKTAWEAATKPETN